MEICIGINDDIQQTFSRYDDFKKQRKPKTFVSSFLGDYAHLNIMLSSQNSQMNNNQVDISNNQNTNNDLLGIGDFSSSNNQNNNTNNQNNQNNDGKQYMKDLNDIFG